MRIPRLAHVYTMSRRARPFLDRLRIYVKSGAGSPGNPKIKGKGGSGGSVILNSVEGLSLTDIVSDYPKKRFIVRLLIYEFLSFKKCIMFNLI